MLELRQLDLKFAFPRPSTLGKNVEDERGPVEDLAVEEFLQIARLGRGKFVVKNDRIDICLAAIQSKLVSLAFADVRACARRGQFLEPIAYYSATGGCRQLRKLLQRAVAVPLAAGLEFHAYEKNPLSSSVSRLE
jgi:hypothetical protein